MPSKREGVHWSSVGLFFTGIQQGCCSLGFHEDSVYSPVLSGDAVHWSSIFSLERLNLPGVKGIDPIFPLK